jgi:mannose-6-phosphate isomerase-like protein (cupin superfamily)
VHCTLPPSRTTSVVRHRTVDELWYFLAGAGQVWRSTGHESEITDVHPGVSISIPVGTSFQFRAVEDAPLVFVITTIPPWPGEQEAEPVDGPWQPNTP